jgi:translation initiation factor IF-1
MCIERSYKMSKESNIEIEGEVVDKLPAGRFKVKLENGHEIDCTVSGKIRVNNIRIVAGDKVKIAVSPYDMNNGYITRRL